MNEEIPKPKHKELTGLSEREKAILIYAAQNDVKDWQLLYIISRDYSERTPPPPNVKTMASRWKNSARVRKFYTDQKTIHENKIKQIRNEIVADLRARQKAAAAPDIPDELDPNPDEVPRTTPRKRGRPRKADIINEKYGLTSSNSVGDSMQVVDNQEESDFINFTDRMQFIAWLNEKANGIADEKQRMEYLKILSDLLQFKDENKRNTEQMRFYVPIKCLQCALYQEKREELESEAAG